ncbi:MAG: tetratricopeptide repeat protein [Lyngbya sp.]|nr:tetratricopeptide repeat protein [Lyngbya sp.]
MIIKPSSSQQSPQLEEARQLNEQAFQLRQPGRYSEAERLIQRSLAIREKARGTEHPDVAQSLNNWAGLYASQERRRRK